MNESFYHVFKNGTYFLEAFLYKILLKLKIMNSISEAFNGVFDENRSKNFNTKKRSGKKYVQKNHTKNAQYFYYTFFDFPF